MNHDHTLRTLRDSLDDLRDERTTLPEFNRLWRSQSALLAALPPRYAQVLEDVLARLESAALFAEASCSFDQHDLLEHLGLWLDKARLAAAEAP